VTKTVSLLAVWLNGHCHGLVLYPCDVDIITEDLPVRVHPESGWTGFGQHLLSPAQEK
jgi:hypothetical protein